jgi:translation initiation factor 1A
MPPNKKGGKNYKKGKHSDDTPIVYEKEEDQMYGRILKVLGNCNVLVFCNDGRERICHIRGSLKKKKIWINTGDIILLSIRDFGKEEVGKMGRGDVCNKYEQSAALKLRQKDPSINPKLFNNIETLGSEDRKNVIDDEGFDFDEVSEEEEDDEEDNIKNKLNKGGSHYSNRLAQRRAVDSDSDDDVNIDDI